MVSPESRTASPEFKRFRGQDSTPVKDGLAERIQGRGEPV
jgi:hypothetical protein